MLVLVPALFVVGLGLALLVKRPVPLASAVCGMLFFLPNVISLVVIGLIWQFLLVDQHRRRSTDACCARSGSATSSLLGEPDLALCDARRRSPSGS